MKHFPTWILYTWLQTLVPSDEGGGDLPSSPNPAHQGTTADVLVAEARAASAVAEEAIAGHLQNRDSDGLFAFVEDMLGFSKAVVFGHPDTEDIVAVRPVFRLPYCIKCKVKPLSISTGP